MESIERVGREVTVRGDAGDGPAIRIMGLSKTYRKVRALDSLSLAVTRGEVLGLLGPNGSGKTTTLRLLLGLLRPTSGSATVAGFDCWDAGMEVRRRVSYLPGELRLYGSLSGLGVLRLLSGLRDGVGLDRAVAIAERIMKLDLNRRVRTYSTGMKQKLALAQAFADPVDLLFLDEPTSALDPSARGTVLDLVQEARRQGQTVLFSGHVLAEVEQVADRVAIMRRGRLMHIEDMHERRGLRMLLIRFAGENGAGEPPIPAELGLVERDRPAGGAVLFEHHGALDPLLVWLAQAPVADLAIGTEDLRALYDRFHGPSAPDEDDSP